jgi:hypothetical protein
MAGLVTLEKTKLQYTDGVADVSRISPTAGSSTKRCRNHETQRDLFRDYGPNVPRYPKCQAFFRECNSPNLILWVKKQQVVGADRCRMFSRASEEAVLRWSNRRWCGV